MDILNHLYQCYFLLCTQIQDDESWLVGWLYSGFTSLQRYFSHIATWKQEITNLLKFKWRGRESNPSPLAPQTKSLASRSLLLPYDESKTRITFYNKVGSRSITDAVRQSPMTLSIFVYCARQGALLMRFFSLFIFYFYYYSRSTCTAVPYLVLTFMMSATNGIVKRVNCSNRPTKCLLR